MTATVRVPGRSIVLGEGRPEIIVPLTGADITRVLEQVELALEAPARILEWRIDLYRQELDAVQHRAEVLAALPAVRGAMGEKHALLVTLRTSAEGGAREVSDQGLAEMLEAVIASGHTDLVDVETSRGAEVVAHVVAAAREQGVLVVGSFHDFDATPGEDELVELLRSQRRAGADVPKIAVTPRHANDVLRLLAASLRVAADGDGPHITISMGTLGAVSRVAAEVFGSAATFATVGDAAQGGASAPGQLAARDVERMLELLRP
ncbi:type I 3-dehydroquinate dehydratase [Brachybacterium muris]|uniref:type I 3-dehydroquinate dehydratase n=1 Tax=Brachybacterium muris TaxID=219301 RepID=UPI0021A824AD|nr:type I 3-dehydroquinate dehydratase [Brachybacterium muris]